MQTTKQVTVRRLSKSDHRRLDEVLTLNRLLYNDGLEWGFEQVAAGERVTLKQLSLNLTERGDEEPAYKNVDRRVQVETLKRVAKSFATWRRRKKSDLRGGKPRFKPAHRFRTLEIYSGVGNHVKLRDCRTKGYVRIKGLPKFRFRTEQQLPSYQPKTIRITRTPCRVTLSLVYDYEPDGRQTVMFPQMPLGLDVGVTNFVTTTEGILEEGSPPRTLPDIARLKRKLSRRMARQRRAALAEGRAYWEPQKNGKTKFRWTAGRPSRRYERTHAQYSRLCYKETLSQRNWLHRISTEIINGYDLIAVEDLSIANMTRSAKGTEENPGKNVAQKTGLNRSILERNWGAFLSQLEYKAERAGIRFVKVRPQHTSQTCFKCGQINPKNRKGEKFHCVNVECGHRDHADVNAAKNVLRRGLTDLGLPESLARGAAGRKKPRPLGPVRLRYSAFKGASP